MKLTTRESYTLFPIVILIFFLFTPCSAQITGTVGDFQWYNGEYWVREYTDGSVTHNIPYQNFTLTIPQKGAIKLSTELEWDEAENPFGMGEEIHDIEIASKMLTINTQKDSEEWTYGNTVNVTQGTLKIMVWPEYYFVGNITGPPEGPNYDETTYWYHNVRGTLYYEYIPSEKTEPNPQEAASISLIDHVLCKQVTENYEPIDITNKFNQTDTVNSLLELEEAQIGDTITWVFTGPNEITIIEDYTLEISGEVTAYYPLDLNQIDNPEGDWIVSVEINNNLMRTDTFKVKQESQNMIPVPYWMIIAGVLLSTLLNLKNRNIENRT